MKPDLSREAPDFTLVLGGPLYQMLCRARLSGTALELLGRRLLVLPLLAWLPLFLLSAWGGALYAGHVEVPFFLDAGVHVRFLVVVPLLIVAELVVHARLRLVVREFITRGLVPPEARARFDAAVDSAARLRNSVPAEILLIVAVYAFMHLVVLPAFQVHGAPTWYGTPTGTGVDLTLAGYWYAYVSLPFFQFLLLRWYFRVFIWTRFLFQVSRIPLNLLPAHPDRAGGLGFLANTSFAFVPLAVAHGAMLAGMVANRIFHFGVPLTEFKFEIGAMVVFVLLLVFVPISQFLPQLARVRRIGLLEYGRLADHYVREFDRKWLRGGAAKDEALVGSADIQSLADLGNSLDVVKEMKPFPVTRQAVIQISIATLLPVAPLMLTVMPLEELVKKLLGVVL